jgi:DNA repair exonuclease SbcCD ATPase subunit
MSATSRLQLGEEANMKGILAIALAAALQTGLAPPSPADEPALEDELATLARSMTRLVEILERQERERVGALSLEKLKVAVSILEIRARKYDALQRELRDLEDEEQSVHERSAAIDAQLAFLRKRLTETAHEGEIAELREEQSDLEIQLERMRSRSEHVSRRQEELRGRIAEQGRLMQDFELLIEDGVEQLQLGAGAPARR